jgi:hypothetical protein
MNVDLARKIDYWVGIPACFILSLFCRLEKAISFKGKTKKEGTKKVLFMEFSEMGSAILAYPAMKKARQVYPGAELYFWIFK